ncbi:MAG: DUF3240 family protein [Burkholderiales bacterium]|nr:DUF3240 family protein [Burkholderiales bacterium]MDE1929159.1 DUF3240 family protein [Burkholderiales bacterium]MDE2157417.1 DUF3240 family protein [Burkholderiales bacterium]MDE2503204.1 DUF3240 family protein [Burkholderiales bacterium]
MSEFLRLNLIFPPSLEHAVTEALIDDPSMPGFTLLHAEGHSSDFSHASAGERVRGRVERRLLWVVIERARLEPVLAALRERVASAEVRWWADPVLALGRLA